MSERFTSKTLISLFRFLREDVTEEDLEELLLVKHPTYIRLKYGLYTKKDPRVGYWPTESVWVKSARAKIAEGFSSRISTLYKHLIPKDHEIISLQRRSADLLLNFAMDYCDENSVKDDTILGRVIADFLECEKIDSAVSGHIRRLDSAEKIFAFLTKTAADHGNVSIKKDPIRFYTFPDLKRRLGISADEAARQIIENDRQLYGDLGLHNTEAAQWAAHMQRHGKNWGFLLNDKDQIVGNFSMTFFTREQEDQFAAGHLIAKAITSESAASEDEDVAIYLMNLSTLKEYAFAESILWERFGDRLLELALNGTYFRGIYCCLFNEDQAPVFTRRGFKHLTSRDGRGEIYHLDLLYALPKSFTRVFPGLSQEYTSRFDTSKIRFGPCPPQGKLTQAQAQQIAGLLYSSDRYILSSVFGSYAEAKVILGNLLTLGSDTVFSPDNLFCAFCGDDDRVIGLILSVKGPINWTAKALREEAFYLGMELKDGLQPVEEKYFPSYAHPDGDILTILDDSVDPLWNSADSWVSAEMMKAFIALYGDKHKMQVHVLQETSSTVVLYRSNGFKSDGSKHKGFTTTGKPPECFHMFRERLNTQR